MKSLGLGKTCKFPSVWYHKHEDECRRSRKICPSEKQHDVLLAKTMSTSFSSLQHSRSKLRSAHVFLHDVSSRAETRQLRRRRRMRNLHYPRPLKSSDPRKTCRQQPRAPIHCTSRTPPRCYPGGRTHDVLLVKQKNKSWSSFTSCPGRRRAVQHIMRQCATMTESKCCASMACGWCVAQTGFFF